jgi:acyl-CoA synthetase (AMP-forming)/AMP-acid ligase II
VIDYKLVDVPDLGYFHTDRPHPRGELLVKTQNMFAGYYKRPEVTAGVYDPDGYYCTGDIMAQTGPDQLVWLDRRNNVVKLSQGEFVAVSKLEAAFGDSPLVRQIYIYGNSARPYLLAVIVPTEDPAAHRAADRRDRLPGPLPGLRMAGTAGAGRRQADLPGARQRPCGGPRPPGQDLRQRRSAAADPLPGAGRDHLEVIVGDKGDADLGLDPQTWRRLADTVDLIVDPAALVNHVLPYSQLFGPNVAGTAELIRLALTTRIKPYTYVSTVGVPAACGAPSA